MSENKQNLMPVAVLIEADQVSPMSLEGIFGIVNGVGEPIVRRAYGDVHCFSASDGWSRAQREFGIVARPQASGGRNKNAAEIALVIDAMSLLYKSTSQGLFIVSGDSDYTALAERIREEGKDVYGIGGETAPESFRRACTKFFLLDVSAEKKKEESLRIAEPSERRGPSYLCPRCGGRLTPSRTKSNQNCRMCASCGGMTAKLSTLENVFAAESLQELKERAMRHEQAGCVCPDCGAQMSLLRVSAGEQRIEIDLCPDCHALWYDRDELEALVPDDGLLLPTVSAGKAYCRDMVTVLASDMRGGRLFLTTLENLKSSLKNIYHVPEPDIQSILGALQTQRIIAVDAAGMVTFCK